MLRKVRLASGELRPLKKLPRPSYVRDAISSARSSYKHTRRYAKKTYWISYYLAISSSPHRSNLGRKIPKMFVTSNPQIRHDKMHCKTAKLPYGKSAWRS
jgi:hypothetical protein